MLRIVAALVLCSALTGCASIGDTITKFAHPDRKKRLMVNPPMSRELTHIVENGERELFEIKEDAVESAYHEGYEKQAGKTR